MSFTIASLPAWGAWAQDDVAAARAERKLLAMLAAAPAPQLACDYVLTPGGAPPLPRFGNGQACVVNFWTPWCRPCKPLLKALAEFSRSHSSSVRAVAAVDWSDLEAAPELEEGRASIEAMLREQGVSFPVCVTRSDRNREAYQVPYVPFTVLIDGRGRVVVAAGGLPRGLRLLDEAKERLVR